MLRPTKHLDLNSCTLRVASIVLSKLKTARVLKHDDLKKAIHKIDENADLAFLPALNLLYLLGRIEYHAQTDSFEYTHSSTNL